MNTFTRVGLVLGLMVVCCSSLAYAGTLTATLVRSDTNAAITVPTGKTVPVICNGSNDQGYFFDIGAGQSSGSVTVPQGISVECYLDTSDLSWLLSDEQVYPYVGQINLTMPANGGSAAFNFAFKPTTGSISINLRNNKTGQPILVPESGQVSVECSQWIGGQAAIFELHFEVGASSLELPVFKKAVYSCQVRGLAGFYTNSSAGVTVPSSGSTTLTFSLEPLQHSVTFQFVDPQGSPFSPPSSDDPASFSCYSENASSWYNFSVNVDIDGATSSITRQFVDGVSYRCEEFEFGPFHVDTVRFNVPAGEDVTVPVTLVPRTVQATFNLQLNGAPYAVPPGGSPRVACVGEVTGEHRGFRTFTVGASSVTVDLFADVQYACVLERLEGYHAPVPIRFTESVGGMPSFTIPLVPMEAFVQVRLRNPDGTPWSAPSELSVYCRQDGGDRLFNAFYPGEVTAGASSMTLQVAGGVPIHCALNSFEGYVIAQPGTKSVAVTGTTTFDFTLYPRDATVGFRLLDGNGELLPELVACNAYVRSADGAFEDLLGGEVTNGVATVAVPHGLELIASAQCDGESQYAIGADEKRYFQPNESSELLTLNSGQTKTADVVFREPDAFVELTVVDETGAPVALNDVYAGSDSMPSGGRYNAYATTDADGQARMPLIAGVKWTLRASGRIDQFTGATTHVGSAAQLLTPSPGAHPTVTLVSKRVTAVVNVTTPTTVVPSGNGYCIARDETGVETYSVEQPPLTHIKPIELSAGRWKIACIGWGSKTDNTFVDLYSEEVTVDVVASAPPQSLTLPLLEGKRITSTTTHFSPQQGSVVSAEGIELIVPPNAIPGSTAQAVLSNHPADTDVSYQPEMGRPVTAFLISFRSVGGTTYSTFAPVSLTLEHPVEQGQDLVVMRFFGRGKGWEVVTNGGQLSANSSTAGAMGLTQSSAGAATRVITEAGVYAAFVQEAPASAQPTATPVPTVTPTAPVSPTSTPIPGITPPTAVTPRPGTTPSATATPAPAALEKVERLRVRFSNSQALISWNPVKGAMQYVIQIRKQSRDKRGEKQPSPRTFRSNESRFTVSKLASGRYTFTVWAVRGALRGPPSSIERVNSIR